MLTQQDLMNAGVKAPPRRQRKEFKPVKNRAGVTIYKAENPANSESHVALYKFNKAGKLVIACVDPEKVDEHLQTLEYFRYADALALQEKRMTAEEYAEKMGFKITEEEEVAPVTESEVNVPKVATSESTQNESGGVADASPSAIDAPKNTSKNKKGAPAS